MKLSSIVGSLGAALVCASGCGARTGLRVDPPAHDAGIDVALPPEPECRPWRVHTRVGTEAPLRVEVDHAAPRTTGYAWSMRAAPPRSMASVSASTADTASITPDVEGNYDIVATTPYALRDGTRLQCPVSVVADPLDPLCPSYALVEPTVVALPGSTAQFGFEAVWSTPRVNAGGPDGTGIVAIDDPADEVAALVYEARAEQDIATVAGELEGRVRDALGATPVLIGREGMTPDGFAYRRSSFRLSSLATSASIVRDRVARDVAGLHPGTAAAGFNAYGAFVLEVTTVQRPDERRAVMIFAAAPERLFDDPQRATAVRLQDVTNTSGLARRGAALDVVCQRITATRTVTADFLWLVDTSLSMEDDQERLGNTAERFFREMNSAGVDFRVGVVQAGNAVAGPDLDNPGFTWIAGDDPNGPRRLAHEVTYQRYRNDPADTFAPYPLEGQEEEPLAAGVVTTLAMERRTDARNFRMNATRAAFFVTDEIGTNDDGRFFSRTGSIMPWGATPEDRVRNVTRWYHDRGFLTFGMANLFSLARCPAVDNFVPCVVTGNGGAYIPLAAVSDAEVSAALSRIVDAVAGAASEFVLTRPPISATLRVRVGDTVAPRSRANGFDWDEPARTIVFRGSTTRPRRGQDVRAAYFLWVRP